MAVAPDLYSGGRRPVCIARTVLDMVRGGDATVGRIGAVHEWLTGQPEVAGDRTGVIGFCMGGGFALLSARKGGYRAVGVNYGSVPKDLTGICPVVGSYGGEDRALLSHARRLDDDLTRLGVAHDVEVYPGAGHSFLNEHKPRFTPPFLKVGYREDAAEDAWRRILAFFAEHVGGVSGATG